MRKWSVTKLIHVKYFRSIVPPTTKSNEWNLIHFCLSSINIATYGEKESVSPKEKKKSSWNFLSFEFSREMGKTRWLMKFGRLRGPLRNLRRGGVVESLKLLKWSAETNRGPTYADGHLDQWFSTFQTCGPQNNANTS